MVAQTERPFFALANNIVEHIKAEQDTRARLDPQQQTPGPLGHGHALELTVVALVESILTETLASEGPILDLATLDAVHTHYEFEAATKDEFDRYLHKQILRARKGRDLTAAELAAFVNDGDEAIR